MEPTVPIRSIDDRFLDRSAAGAKLAERLQNRTFFDPLILALPRGGVPVAYEVARRLRIPMDVLVARKIGSPENPEFAIGAMVEGGFYNIKPEAIAKLHLSEARVELAVERQRREIRRRVAIYRLDQPLPRVKNRDIILIDDGIATGETVRVAIRLLKSRGARRVILAVPVCPGSISHEKDFPEASELVVLRRPEHFRGVGQFYSRFGPVSDEAVLQLTGRGRAFG